MTNAQIIFNASVELMNNGTIRGSGQYITVELDDGSQKRLEIPEPIHTYATWQEMGRQVKKGEKCKARIDIWKQGKGKTVKDEETGEETETAGRMFLKTAYFFTMDQTEEYKPRNARKPG